MSTFIELVVVPAVLPWLIVVIASHIENRLDRFEQAASGTVPFIS